MDTCANVHPDLLILRDPWVRVVKRKSMNVRLIRVTMAVRATIKSMDTPAPVHPNLSVLNVKPSTHVIPYQLIHLHVRTTALVGLYRRRD